MDMKKRITLELRNRTPAEVSNLHFYNMLIIAWNSPWGDVIPESWPAAAPI